MAEDWALDVKKYAPAADDAVIAAVIRYCGIALRTRDASLISFTDKVETDRVRDNFCRKKLGLTEPDAVVDEAIAAVGTVMKADRTRNRVTVYYLLAEKFGKLGLFGAVEAAAAPVVAAAAAAPVVAAVAAAPAAAMPPKAEPAAAPMTPPLAAYDDRDTAGDGMGKWLAILALLAVAALLLWWLFGRSHEAAPIATTEAAATTEAVASVEPAPAAAAAMAIPEGSGVTAAEVDGKPAVSVYFEPAKSDVSPDFKTVASIVKVWVDGHPGAILIVSGYNDPRGDAALNARLSKERAFAVRNALVALGVPETGIDLVKPTDTNDTSDSLANGRRVDISVKDAA